MQRNIKYLICYPILKHPPRDWSNVDWCVITPQPENGRPSTLKSTYVGLDKPRTGLKP